MAQPPVRYQIHPKRIQTWKKIRTESAAGASINGQGKKTGAMLR